MGFGELTGFSITNRLGYVLTWLVVRGGRGGLRRETGGALRAGRTKVPLSCILSQPLALGSYGVATQMEVEMQPKRMAAIAILMAAMAAPAFAQAPPRSASTQHRLQHERMHRPARYHSAYRYEYQPAHLGNEAGVIADDVTGVNPFGAPPYPWGYYGSPSPY
jgi:hypothetical protein